MMMVHHDNRGRPDQRYDGVDGPTCNRPPGVAEPAAGNSSRTSTTTTTSGASVLRGQPFQYLSNHHNSTTSLRSPGMTTAALSFPFTNQQWKELERQAMIYKYMMHSLPVPRDLLFPTTTASSTSSASQSPCPLSGAGFNLRLSNTTDPEPGRCKRTDGKKWRCSRDVAPDQKYCERHMHRGRPRSRKHVEIHANNPTTAAKKLRHENNSHNIMPISTAQTQEMNKNGGYPTQFLGSTIEPFHQTAVYLNKADVKSASFAVNSVSSNREVRGVKWMMKTEAAAPMSSSELQWQGLMQSNKTELSCSRIPYFDATTSVFGQRSEEEECFLNLNSYTNFNAGETNHHHQQDGNDCGLFLNPGVVALENPLLEETPRSFIDAWSKNDNGDNNNPVASSRQLSPASLTLSMGGYNSMSDEMGKTQMSLGCNRYGSGDGIKPQVSTWLMTPSSWVSSPPGGPLAEVLKPTTSAASTPSSPITNNGNHGEFSSPLGTSSPSGVLQKTIASFSDSSGNSSPNFTSSKAKTETLWLNQNKA